MAPKLIFFTGAPSASSIPFTSYTLTSFTQPFTDFLNLPSGSNQAQSPFTSHAAWRSLPLTRQPLPGFSQLHDFDTSIHHEPDFFNTGSVSHSELNPETSEHQELLSQFYDHSLALHNPLPSSLLSSFDSTSLSLEETSFLTTSSTSNPPPLPSHLSDLEDIPPARYITSINPQTITLNLIVGIISIAQPRTVTTRWGRTLSLVEILVCDETKSGFAVTFWLENAAEEAVSALRRQDVVLLQNVALHVFRGKVYGQSLRRGMTKVSLLWRRDGSGHYSARDLSKKGSVHPQVVKTRNVKDWVIEFVGGDPGVKPRASRNVWDRPPDDTQ